LLIALHFRKEKPAVKVKNVGKGEGIFRSILGVLLIIFAFFISGIFQWIAGLVGVIIILTALFGY
jgi:predicted phage tail protein